MDSLCVWILFKRRFGVFQTGGPGRGRFKDKEEQFLIWTGSVRGSGGLGFLRWVGPLAGRSSWQGHPGPPGGRGALVPSFCMEACFVSLNRFSTIGSADVSSRGQ